MKTFLLVMVLYISLFWIPNFVLAQSRVSNLDEFKAELKWINKIASSSSVQADHILKDEGYKLSENAMLDTVVKQRYNTWFIEEASPDGSYSIVNNIRKYYPDDICKVYSVRLYSSDHSKVEKHKELLKKVLRQQSNKPGYFSGERTFNGQWYYCTAQYESGGDFVWFKFYPLQ